MYSQLIELMCIDVKDFSADKLFERFRNKILELNIPFSNIVALLCNNASVMTENHSLFKKEFKKLCDLMTFLCSCHSVALVTHNACDKIPTFCEIFIKAKYLFIFIYINDRSKHLSYLRNFVNVSKERIIKY